MKELVETVALALADKPDAVVVRESNDGELITIDVAVATEDLGRVIGKEGRTARALRALASAAGRKQHRRVLVRIAS